MNPIPLIKASTLATSLGLGCWTELVSEPNVRVLLVAPKQFADVFNGGFRQTEGDDVAAWAVTVSNETDFATAKYDPSGNQLWGLNGPGLGLALNREGEVCLLRTYTLASYRPDGALLSTRRAICS